jgi:hypothetical protein
VAHTPPRGRPLKYILHESWLFLLARAGEWKSRRREGNEKLNAMTVVEMNFYSRFKFSFVVF